MPHKGEYEAIADSEAGERAKGEGGVREWARRHTTIIVGTVALVVLVVALVLSFTVIHDHQDKNGTDLSCVPYTRTRHRVRTRTVTGS